MKTASMFLSFVLVATLLTGCSLFNNIVGSKSITPSGNVVTEDRSVSGFTSIDMKTLGNLIITQGDTESLTISGSDNVVPLVTTTVNNGVLIIDMKERINILSSNNEAKVLTFTIGVKDLSSLTVSGLAEVNMDSLSTSKFTLAMSGAGHILLSDLATEEADITLSGLGGVEISGEATHGTFNLSGAGEIQAGDLKCQTADVNLSGLGSATIWVTDELSGKITGAGGVKYYGSPQTSTESTGLGKFESLGDK